MSDSSATSEANTTDQNLGFVILTNSMTGISSALMYYIMNAFLGEDNRDWSAYFQENTEKSNKRHEDWINSIKSTRVKGTRPSLSTDMIVGKYFDPMFQ